MKNTPPQASLEACNAKNEATHATFHERDVALAKAISPLLQKAEGHLATNLRGLIEPFLPR